MSDGNILHANVFRDEEDYFWLFSLHYMSYLSRDFTRPQLTTHPNLGMESSNGHLFLQYSCLSPSNKYRTCQSQNVGRVCSSCVFSQLGVSTNGGAPKSSILIRFSLINHPFSSTTIYGNPQLIFAGHPENR